MILWILYGIVVLIAWPFISRYLLENVPVGKPETLDYYMATLLGLILAFCWPAFLPVGLFFIIAVHLIFRDYFQ